MENSIRIFTGKEDISYIDVTFTKKRIKNLNLRVTPNGEVKLSVPVHTSRRYAEQFLQSRSEWIYGALKKAASRRHIKAEEISYDEACSVLQPLVEQLAPMFEKYSGIKIPVVHYKYMKSMWGICYPDKQAITLNTRLARVPVYLAEYVVLHELVHFIHPNHGAAFHAEMEKRMPDYKQRRKALKLYS